MHRLSPKAPGVLIAIGILSGSLALVGAGRAVPEPVRQVQYGTYLSGRGVEYVHGMCVDAAGNTYITGNTDSRDFRVVNALQPEYGGNDDAFVTKIGPDGAVLFSTYLGGDGPDEGHGICVDSAGDIYVTGFTTSETFPVARAFQPKIGGAGDAFLCKLDSDGRTLVYSTFLGGSEYENLWPPGGVAVDAAGSAVVVGFTDSTDFPVQAALQPRLAGADDVFVARFSPDGANLVFATYVGGRLFDRPTGSPNVAIGPDGAIHVAGSTWSPDFPTRAAIQPRFGGGTDDAFLCGLSPTGTSLVYSTFLGGSDRETGGGVAIDPLGNISIAGTTGSSDFPVTSEAYQRSPGRAAGGSDAFCAKLAPGGGRFVYSTYLGGHSDDTADALFAAADGSVYLAGTTSGGRFPMARPIQAARGYADAFVSRLSPDGAWLMFSTYLGGHEYIPGDFIVRDSGHGIGVDARGRIHVAGNTSSPDFPITPGAAERMLHFFDGFYTRIGPVLVPASGALDAPRRVRFGTVKVGRRSRQRVRLYNGGDDLTLTLGAVDPPFYGIPTPREHVILGERPNLRFELEFRPSKRGTFRGNLAIASSDPTARVKNILLIGTAK